MKRAKEGTDDTSSISEEEEKSMLTVHYMHHAHAHFILILYIGYSSIQQFLHGRELTEFCCFYNRALGNNLSILSTIALVMHVTVIVGGTQLQCALVIPWH